MPRPENVTIQVPGETAVEPAAEADAVQADQPQAAEQPAQAQAGAEPDTAAPVASTEAEELAKLRAQLVQLEAENEALKTQTEEAPKITDSTVFEPVTKHGAQALALSEFASMTCADVHAKLQSGEITLAGKPSVLCADGYYCDPSYR